MILSRKLRSFNALARSEEYTIDGTASIVNETAEFHKTIVAMDIYACAYLHCGRIDEKYNRSTWSRIIGKNVAALRRGSPARAGRNDSTPVARARHIAASKRIDGVFPQRLYGKGGSVVYLHVDFPRIEPGERATQIPNGGCRRP
jgi:hypothetical protein